MKYLCFGYVDDKKFETMSASERELFIKECRAYDDILRADGHFLRLEGLARAADAKTLRAHNGNVIITDGPYAETKEQIAGILLLEAADLAHAATLMSQHPGLRVGVFEIRAVDDPSCERMNTHSNS